MTGRVSLRLLLLCLLLLDGLGKAELRAQSWRANWGEGRHPSSPEWRYDLEAFEIQEGWLSLSAHKGLANAQSTLMTSVTLPPKVRWRGRVRLDLPPSKRNHSYILLACFAANTTLKQYDYVALSLGGGDRSNASLVSLRLSPRGSGSGARFSLSHERILISGRGFSMTSALELRYDVRYEEGHWRLYLQRVGEAQAFQLIGQTEEELRLSDLRNTFGFVCLSTPRYRSATHFTDIEFDDKVDEGMEMPQPSPEDDPSTSYLLLTEIMAHPEPGGEEYIEIHNPTSREISTDGVGLLIGKNLEQAKYYPLPKSVVIPPETYLVLTKSPSAVQMTHPNVYVEDIIQAPLPRLNNSGCYIGLYRAGVGVIDDVLYLPRLKEEGLRSRAGVALERIRLSDRSRYPNNTGNWTSALSSGGFASPTRPNTRLRDPFGRDSQGEGGERIARLVDLLQELRSDPQASVLLMLYDLSGCRLVEMRGERAIGWLETLTSHAPSALEALPTIHRGVMILQLVVRSRERGVQTYSLSFLRP